MRSIVEKLRDLTMSKEDRLLRRYELVDDAGLTSEGNKAVMDYMFKQVKPEIVKDLLELEKEAKISKRVKGDK